MIVYTVLGQKGGVGKTTLAVNLAVEYARRGRRVLAVDLDAGAGLTTWLDVSPGPDLADFVLGDGKPERYAATTHGLDVIPSAKASTVALEYDDAVLRDRERRLLKRRLRRSRYDTIILDTAPGVTMLTANAIMAANRLIAPVLCDFLSLKALAELRVDLVEYRRVGGAARVAVIPMMYHSRRRISAEVLDALNDEYGANVGPPVRVSVRFAEAPSYHKPIMEYDPKGRGAEDVAAVADFLTQMEVKDGK